MSLSVYFSHGRPCIQLNWNACSGFYPNANDLNRNVPEVKSWVWKFKMFLKYHKDAIPGKKRKIKDDTKTVDCKKKYEETQELFWLVK
jgi:hypothetical protein